MDATQKLQQFVSFVNRTGNADNVFRLVVGLNMLVRAQVRDKCVQDSLVNASSAMNECRHTLRLLGILKQMASLLNHLDNSQKDILSGQSAQSIQGFLTLAKTVSMTVFFACDGLGWAQKFGVVRKDCVETGRTACQMWLVYIILDIASVLLQLQGPLQRHQSSELVRSLIINCIDFPVALSGSFAWPRPLLSPTAEALLNIGAVSLSIHRDWPLE
eukprot:gb/GEZN01014629.1/.p1 GENE.gb/GEZN01014629.1/~~gb/GEZN01014629.1/.p1  ORF type:complete len:216 (-),score=13.23 gb/GEZN01014629.1/:51-698(-)